MCVCVCELVQRGYLEKGVGEGERCFDIMYKYIIWSYATAARRKINDKKRFTPNWHG